METVLLILKIIGIILLWVIGIILLLAALIMFYPVSYKMQAAYEDSLYARVKVHWLFHLISVTLDYKDAGKKCILRILGIPIMDFLNLRPKKEKKKKPKKNNETKAKKKPVSDISEKSKSKSRALENKEGSGKTTNTEFLDSADTEGFSEDGNSSEHTEESKSKLKSLWEKLTGFPEKLKVLIETIIQKATNLYHKGIDLKDKAEKWVEVLKRERTRLAIGKAKQKIIGLLKHILPRKWNAYVEYGLENPGTTGQIYGYYWMFLGIWSEHFICVPDFEHKIFKGSISAKGHMLVIKFLYVAFQFMFDKDLVYLRKINTEVNS